MVTGDSGPGSCMVVVGDPCSEFVRAMVRLAREYEVEVMPCDDVYSAVVAAARADGHRVLIVGTLHNLAREGGRFFQIAEMNSLRCCCLLSKNSMGEAGALLAALRAGTSIVGDVQEVKAVLVEWLAGGRRRVVHRSLQDLTDDDMRATEAELLALLGHGTEG